MVWNLLIRESDGEEMLTGFMTPDFHSLSPGARTAPQFLSKPPSIETLFSTFTLGLSAGQPLAWAGWLWSRGGSSAWHSQSWPGWERLCECGRVKRLCKPQRPCVSAQGMFMALFRG